MKFVFSYFVFFVEEGIFSLGQENIISTLEFLHRPSF